MVVLSRFYEWAGSDEMDVSVECGIRRERSLTDQALLSVDVIRETTYDISNLHCASSRVGDSCDLSEASVLRLWSLTGYLMGASILIEGVSR